SSVPALPTFPGTTTTETIAAGGISRTTIVYTPTSRRAGEPVPAILLFHGPGQTASLASQAFGLSAEAERLGFLAVYPESANLTGLDPLSWNSGEFTPRGP